ncbi:TatD family hydrolase [uncultured Duncaniella sp.]|uniref:TatD family hydrolase n=1 Tax=uncultured Duncaniella sp. TaxID=2768039 RepID=UPI0025FF857B|nr:TatD family hydrolase [uncultured Duncaniella sp.]
MLIDTHTHLYLDEFGSEKTETVTRALQAGVTRMIFPNVDLSTIRPMKELHAMFPSATYMAMGLHPTEIGESWESGLRIIHDELDANPADYIAVGEIGIDLYWDKTFKEEQMKAFSIQVDWAIERNLPVIIHCRDGLRETLEVLSAKKVKPKAVFHSFGGSVEDVKAIREIGDFYFGINGIVTFKNSGLHEVLPEIGIERIVLETDAPYLAPVPYRGKRNESAYIVKTAARVAEIMSMSVDDVSRMTSDNAIGLFDRMDC